MTLYRTLEGDVLDAICFGHYGRQDMVEAVLDSNPGLGATGPVYAAGIVVLLPDAPVRPARAPLRLWGTA